MKNICTLVLMLSFITMRVDATSGVTEGLKQALKNGNAHEVSKYFENTVEIDLLGKDEVYNKGKAEQVLSIFFNQYQVTNFSVLYEGGKDTNQYAIGKLTTSKGIFRVTILLKSAAILQLRIEADNGN